MTDPPTSPVQAATRIAESAVASLKSAPVLMCLLLLNAIGIASALYFLTKLAAAQAARFDIILKACLPKIGAGP